MTTIPAYPLAWPPGWPRTKPTLRAAGPFKVTITAALANVTDEVRRLGGKMTCISSNVTLGAQNPADPGVAVYFSYDGEETAIPCDRWTRVEANLQAIAKTIEAMRGIERWGAKHMVKAAFRGFAQLAGPQPAAAWHSVLGVAAHASTDEVRAAYRALRGAAHPDRHGGSTEHFDAIQRAWAAACAERGISP
jgi:uncharacterized protein with beta-barrel porin domain